MPVPTDIFANTRRPTRCASHRCGAAIVFAQLVKSGRVMPFNAPLEVLRAEQQPDGRLVETVDLTTNHWATCPDRQRFGHRAR